jgi:hypothetical protein
MACESRCFHRGPRLAARERAIFLSIAHICRAHKEAEFDIGETGRTRRMTSLPGGASLQVAYGHLVRTYIVKRRG